MAERKSKQNDEPEVDPFADTAVKAPEHEVVNPDGPASGTHSASPEKKTAKATTAKSVPDPLAEKTDPAATEAAARSTGSLHAANFTSDEKEDGVFDALPEQTSESVQPGDVPEPENVQEGTPVLQWTDLPYTFADNDEHFPWVANVIQARGHGRAAIDLRPQSWTGDSPLVIDMREAEIVLGLLQKAVDATKAIRQNG